MRDLGDSLLAFSGIEFVLAMDSEELNLAVQTRGRIGKSERKKCETKTGRKPLKSHETAKSDISCHNDFNSLRGGLRNKIVSQAKFSLRLRNISTLFVSHRNLRTVCGGCGDS
jgi:hypothetical protein